MSCIEPDCDDAEVEVTREQAWIEANARDAAERATDLVARIYQGRSDPTWVNPVHVRETLDQLAKAAVAQRFLGRIIGLDV